MEDDLKEQMVKAFMRFKKVHFDFPSHINLHLTELFALARISDVNAGISNVDLQQGLLINKSAVSQMLYSLEQKGYIERKTNETDRRKMNLCLTEDGEKAMREMRCYVEQTTTEVIERFGEEKTAQLLLLIDEFAKIFDQIRMEAITRRED